MTWRREKQNEVTIVFQLKKGLTPEKRRDHIMTLATPKLQRSLKMNTIYSPKMIDVVVLHWPNKKVLPGNAFFLRARQVTQREACGIR